MILNPEYLGVIRNARNIGEELRLNWETPKRWKLIREFYAEIEPYILDGERVSPYMVPLADFMTPIEYAVWCDIRCYGLPFYMQYPVGRRFVDFGDPVRKIAIEVDGKAYHSPEKDAPKNAEILNEGWYLFRVTGRDALYRQDAIAKVAGIYGVDIPSGDEWQESEQ